MRQELRALVGALGFGGLDAGRLQLPVGVVGVGVGAGVGAAVGVGVGFGVGFGVGRITGIREGPGVADVGSSASLR